MPDCGGGNAANIPIFAFLFSRFYLDVNSHRWAHSCPLHRSFFLSLPRAMSDLTNAPENNLEDSTSEPVEQQPVAEQPAPEQSEPEQSAPEQPAPEQPAPEQPAPEQPAPEQPAPEQPAAEQPLAIGAVVHTVASDGPVIVLTPEQVAAAHAEAEAAKQKRAEDKARREQETAARDAAFEELTKIKEANGTLTITITERVKGGLRADYNHLRLFLPASQFSIKRNPPEADLAAAVGQQMQVTITDLTVDDLGMKSGVVSRKSFAEADAWQSVKVGDVLEGVVRQTHTFGAFVSIGDLEGLVHISRLSKSRVESADDVVKKGQRITVKVVSIDPATKKIGLSHKEFAADLWDGVAEKFTIGLIVPGTITRIADYGAHVQVAPGVQALLRNADLSWTKRSDGAAQMFTVGQTVNVAVIEVDSKARRMMVSHRLTQPNPWPALVEELPVGTELEGVVVNLSAQGAVVRIKDSIDAFMPRSRFLSGVRTGKIAVKEGDPILVTVMAVEADRQSIILAHRAEDGTIGGADGERGGDRGERSDRGSRGPREGRGDRRESSVEVPREHAAQSSGVALGDLLSDALRSGLNKG